MDFLSNSWEIFMKTLRSRDCADHSITPLLSFILIGQNVIKVWMTEASLEISIPFGDIRFQTIVCIVNSQLNFPICIVFKQLLAAYILHGLLFEPNISSTNLWHIGFSLPSQNSGPVVVTEFLLSWTTSVCPSIWKKLLFV